MTEIKKLTKEEKEALSKRWNKEMEKLAEKMLKDHKETIDRLLGYDKQRDI